MDKINKFPEILLHNYPPPFRTVINNNKIEFSTAPPFYPALT